MIASQVAAVALVADVSAAGGPSHNTLVVFAGVAAVGFAAGLVGALLLLRKRPLAGDAAAHATLGGVAAAFLATGRRDLPTLLAGALVSALAALAVLVLLRRFTRTRDDAATAIVIGVSFGVGVALLSGITARGLPGSAGLEQFLLGQPASLTARDAAVLIVASLAAVLVALLTLKETVLVAFDAAFAASGGWPVGPIDAGLVTLVAVMVVVGLPAAGAVLVTALILIPPVAARQWTDRVGTMLLLAGLIGLVAAMAGVAASGLRPGLATGPMVVLAAAAMGVVSFLLAPRRGWLSRRLREVALARRWARGRVLEHCLALAGANGAGAFLAADVLERAGGDAGVIRRSARRAWHGLVRAGSVTPAAATPARPEPAGRHWRLSPAGLGEARERRRRVAAWLAILDASVPNGRDGLTLDLPAPEQELAGAAGVPAPEEAP